MTAACDLFILFLGWGKQLSDLCTQSRENELGEHL